MNRQESKKDYVDRIEREFDEWKGRLLSIGGRMHSGEFDNEAGVKDKYAELENKLSALSWRIDNFKQSQTPLDETVKKSFADLFDEINWRYDAVKAAMGGKELWESEEAARRGKKLYE